MDFAVSLGEMLEEGKLILNVFCSQYQNKKYILDKMTIPIYILVPKVLNLVMISLELKIDKYKVMQIVNLLKYPRITQENKNF